MKNFLRIFGWLLLPILILFRISDYKIIASLEIPFRRIDIIVTFMIFLISLNITLYIIEYFYRKRKDLTKGQSDNIIIGVNNIYYLILIGAILAKLLLFLGFDIYTLFTSLSIFAAAFAILSKDFVSNITSGMLIAFSDELNIGDNVQIGAKRGKIIDITLLKLILLNDDDDYVIIPNSTVYSNEVINYTRREIKKTSIDFEVDIHILENIEQLEKELIESVKEYHDCIKADSYRVKVVEIKKEYVALKFQYTLNQYDRELERDVRRLTVRKIVNLIKKYQDKTK